MKRTFKLVLLTLCMVLAMGVVMQVTATDRVYAQSKSISRVEAHGIWHRPNSSGKETTLEGMCEVLDMFKNAGINMVFLETFYHGMTFFKNNLIPYYTGFEQYTYGQYPDYLTAFATEAEKRGIEVHAWVQDFYIGINEEATLVKYFSDWLLVNQDGGIRHMLEGMDFGGYIFLDPANSEVQDYLLKFYDLMLTTVPAVKGLNLDYIRYPVSDIASGNDAGYTETCMKQFAEQYNIELDETNMRSDLVNKLKSNTALYADWTEFRAGFVTAFVEKVYNMVNTKHQGKMISTAVFPELDQAYQNKKQDIRTWLNEGYIDIVTPMVYFYEASQIKSAVEQMMQFCGDAYCYTGLYTTYHNQDNSQLQQHIEASNSAGADGFVLFDAAKTFFDAKYDYETFLVEQYGGDEYSAIVPHSDAETLTTSVSNGLMSFLRSQAEDGIEDTSKVQQFGEQLKLVSDTGEQDIATLKVLLGRLDTLIKNIDSYISTANSGEVTEVLQSMHRNLTVRLSRMEVKGIENPDGTTPPDDDKDDGGSEPLPTPDDNETDPPTSDNTTKLLSYGVVLVVGFALGLVTAFAIKSNKRGKQ